MSKYSAEERLLYRLQAKLKKAIDEYGLIQDGDTVLVGLSGGKDSLALIELLAEKAKVFRPRFQLKAVHVVMENIPYQSDTDYLAEHCRTHHVPFLLKRTAFDSSNDHRKSPCFLCSWNRRKALFETAQENACNKIALGHHRDDLLETLLMNMFFQGSIQTMPPLLQMNKFPMQVIRPMSLISEDELRKMAVLRQYPSQSKACPYEKDSFRPSVRKLLEEIETLHPGAKDSLWASMQHIYPGYLPKPMDK